MRLELRLVAGENSVKSVFVNNDNISVRIVNSSGAVIEVSENRPWRCSQNPRFLWLATLSGDPVLDTRRYLVLNEWCSTDLPPGDYSVEVTLSRLGIVKVGKVESEGKNLGPPLTFVLPLAVLATDDDAVCNEFAQLLAEASKPAAGAEYEKHKEIARAIEMIVYSREPLALPAQLELLSGRVEMWSTTFVFCHAVDLLIYLIDQNNTDVAKGLVKALDDLHAAKYPNDSSTRHLLSELVVWAIHEMHERGGPEVMRITEPIVQALPKPRDPRNEAF